MHTLIYLHTYGMLTMIGFEQYLWSMRPMRLSALAVAVFLDLGDSVAVHACTYAHMYICIFTHICISSNQIKSVFIFTYVYIYISVICVHMYIYMIYVHILCIYIQNVLCIYMYLYQYVYIYM